MNQDLPPFASASVAAHLARGVGAVVLLVLAWRSVQTVHGWSALVALPLAAGALLLLRGCPICWLIGLVGTLAHRLGERRRHA